MNQIQDEREREAFLVKGSNKVRKHPEYKLFSIIFILNDVYSLNMMISIYLVYYEYEKSVFCSKVLLFILYSKVTPRLI